MLEKKREKCHDTTEGKREREKIFLMKCRYWSQSVVELLRVKCLHWRSHHNALWEIKDRPGLVTERSCKREGSERWRRRRRERKKSLLWKKIASITAATVCGTSIIQLGTGDTEEEEDELKWRGRRHESGIKGLMAAIPQMKSYSRQCSVCVPMRLCACRRRVCRQYVCSRWRR